MSGSATTNPMPRPLVVQYLYVHDRDEAFYYPSVRSRSSAARVAIRYLECAIAQAASLRLQDAECDLALVTNLKDWEPLGRTGAKLRNGLTVLGVEILHAEYRHRPEDESTTYVSSRYVLDAVLSATEGQVADRQICLTDLDCIWARPERIFQFDLDAAELGCIVIPYPPDWDVVGFGEHGLTREAIGVMASSMGGERLPPWIGGELILGAPQALRDMVRTCEEVDAQLALEGKTLPTEEQVFSLVGALGRVSFRDLSSVAGRIQTGSRHEAKHVENAADLGLWHLPAEKGLSLRRAAQAVCRGRTARLRRDLLDSSRAARRFNIADTGVGRKIRDDSWIVAQRIHGMLRPG